MNDYESKVWWCEKHRSGRQLALGSPAPETCDTYQAMCLRIGKNPFSPKACKMVEAKIVVKP